MPGRMPTNTRDVRTMLVTMTSRKEPATPGFALRNIPLIGTRRERHAAAGRHLAQTPAKLNRDARILMFERAAHAFAVRKLKMRKAIGICERLRVGQQRPPLTWRTGFVSKLKMQCLRASSSSSSASSSASCCPPLAPQLGSCDPWAKDVKHAYWTLLAKSHTAMGA